MITSTMHEIKILNSLYVSFNAYPNLAAPRIPAALEESRKVSHCCRSHFNQMLKLVPRDDSCQLNYDLQLVPDVAIRRYKWDPEATKEARRGSFRSTHVRGLWKAKTRVQQAVQLCINHNCRKESATSYRS